MYCGEYAFARYNGRKLSNNFEFNLANIQDNFNGKNKLKRMSSSYSLKKRKGNTRRFIET